MANKSNFSGCFNILNRNGLAWYVDKYAIPASLHPVLPEKDTHIYPSPQRKIGVYTRLFDYCNYRLPLTKFFINVLLFHEVHLSQMNPFGLAKVSEAIEVNKSSQASAATAYEARDKALQDLEALKLKFGDLEKKLSDAEKRHKAELKEIQTSYNQLLADHHRLINDKGELERACDRAIEWHKATIDEAKGMLTRCDGEMVELYAQVSEPMLTKQWFLTDGIAWVVKLVHQILELEKVVADLVNNVNVVGVNEGIKQGFQAAGGLARSFEEVSGYDE
ncbi:hypothetical protein Hdeb2414_s0004g00139791 [Helianthus debilis subsp. tardiflorus]